MLLTTTEAAVWSLVLGLFAHQPRKLPLNFRDIFRTLLGAAT